MNLSIKNLMLMMAIFLNQLTLFPDMAYSQSQNRKLFPCTGVVPDEAIDRLRAIYEGSEFSARSFRATWNPDGSGYLVLETLPGEDQQALVSYDASSGKRKELITNAQLVLPGVTGPLFVESYEISFDGKKILLKAGSYDGESNNSGYWMLDVKSGTFQKVVAGNSNSISPEGQRILFSDQGNLHVYDLNSDQTTQLTSDAVEGSVWNGRASWSPDGKRIAYVQTDASGVRIRSSLVPGDPTYPEIRETSYARVGGMINKLVIAVMDAAGKETRWLSISTPTEGYYLGQVGWVGNSDELLVEKLSRFRDKREFYLVDVTNGKTTVIFEESDPAWVVASYHKNSGLIWIRDYSAFLVLSEKDGWRHAWVCSRDGKHQ